MPSKPTYEELKQKVSELTETNEKLHSLFDTLPQIIVETDLKGNLLYANQKTFELTGYNTEDFTNGINATQLVIPEERSKAIQNMQKILNGEKLQGNEYVALRKDGSTYPVRVYSSYKLENGKTTGIRSIIIDITELKQTEADREKLIIKLQKALDEINTYQAQLKVMALFDQLTGLPNRRLFFDRLNMTLEHNRRNRGMFSVFFLDLDGLKIVNDSFGHEAGDEVLCAVAELLKKVSRKSDTIARLGGDEFAMIIDQLKSAKDAEIAAEKIIAALATPIKLKTSSVNMGASIGISLFPIDSDEAEELVRLADKSMYTSKNQGGNAYTFFCEDTNS